MTALRLLVVRLAHVGAFLLVALVIGATDGLGSINAMTVRVDPLWVPAGKSVTVTAVVKPARVVCSGTISRRSTTLKLRRKKAVGIYAVWRPTIPANAPRGTWTARVSCGHAGWSTALFRVTAPAPPPTIPAKVVAVKSGVSSRYSTIGSTYAGYGVVLQNASPDEDALNVDVTVNILDASGRILVSDSTTYEAIPAGATYYAGGESMYNGATPAARLEVMTRIGEHQKKSIGTLPPVSNVRFSERFSGVDVLGELSNPYTKTLSPIARITAVCFDGSGNVIGGGRGYPSSSVTPGGRIGFDVSIEGLKASQIASAQVSVEPEVTS